MSSSTRRQFLAQVLGGSALLTFGAGAPGFLRQAAAASRSDGRVLVVIELSGGNDGLNSIVPFGEQAYRHARPKLAIPKAETLMIEPGIGFHPSLRGFADLLEAGRFSAVQGVGYPDPNRSHFESMDIWHSCLRKDHPRTEGWLGRYLEAAEAGQSADPAAIHLGAGKQPFALMARSVRVPSVQSLEEFRLRAAGNAGFKQAVHELAASEQGEGDGLLDFVQSSTASALAASERLESAGATYKPAVAYPDSALGQKLSTIARLIAADLATSVYYVQLDGFDTHASQPAAHAALLRELSEAVVAFDRDLVAAGHGERVLTLGFSEFGRRVDENASQGTDHGTAGPIFLAGGKLRPGLIGKHPSLDDLEQGDLRHHTDFRQVYATVLEHWLNCPSESILGGKFAAIDFFDKLS